MIASEKYVVRARYGDTTDFVVHVVLPCNPRVMSPGLIDCNKSYSTCMEKSDIPKTDNHSSFFFRSTETITQ